MPFSPLVEHMDAILAAVEKADKDLELRISRSHLVFFCPFYSELKFESGRLSSVMLMIHL